MLERDGESRTQKLLPLSTRPNFSWMEWKAYLFIFAATTITCRWASKKEALTTNFSAVVESAAVKTARILKYVAANAAIVMAICQAAMFCDEARAVVTAHQLSDPEANAYNLFKLLEARFTQKALKTLAKLLVELNQFISAAGETTIQLLDRFNKIVLGVTAIDATQLPTELQLITILKNAISVRFKMLYAMLEATANLTLILLKEKVLNWEMKNEIGGDDQGQARFVANFTGSGFDQKRKKAFVKKIKSGANRDQANSSSFSTIICYNCDGEGHMK